MMRWLLLSILVLLSGCDLEHFEREQTIRAGKVFWKGPDVGRLEQALQACINAPASLQELCAERLQEAQTLIVALKTCAGSSLPTCQAIKAWHRQGEGRQWAQLTPYLHLTPTAFDRLPVEDLDTFRPHNAFIWSVWGWSDVKTVMMIRLLRYKTYLLIGLSLPVLVCLGALGWRGRHWWADKKAARQVSQQREANRQREEAERRQHEERRKRERMDEEARQHEEAIRQIAVAKAREEARRQQLLQEQQEAKAAEQELQASQERAKQILEIALGGVTPPEPPRPTGRWSTLKRPSTGENAESIE
jgi:hypothetical protein